MFRIVFSSHPLAQSLRVGKFRVCHQFANLLVARVATTILGWAGALAINTLRIDSAGFDGANLLKENFVLPTVSKIVGVIHFPFRMAKQFKEGDGIFISHVQLLDFRTAKHRVSEVKRVHVAVLPSH